MCNKIDPEAVDRAVGYFDKRGDGNPQRFPILVAICECESTYWARTPTGMVWVVAEKMDEQQPGLDETHAMAKEVSECTGFGSS